jgi:hypothetical protein
VHLNPSPDPEPPDLPPAAVREFLTALGALSLADWHRVLTVARTRGPGDRALLDALTVLSITTARLGLHHARREVEARVACALAPIVLPPPERGPGDFDAAAGRQLGQLTLADQATLQFAAEWAAAALLVRDALAPEQLALLYAPFAAVVPMPDG